MTHARDKSATKSAIEKAILKVQNLRLPMSISAVAREVGIKPSTIHKVYPDCAEQIRALMGRSTREQRNKKHEALTAAKATIRELREQVEVLERDCAKLASINYAQKQELARLEAMASGKVVAMRAMD